MPGQAGDFIQQLMGMIQLRNQMREVQIKEQQLTEAQRAAAIQRYADFARQAETLPPDSRTELIGAFERQGGNRSVLEQIAAGLPMSRVAQQQTWSQAGFAAAPPERQAAYRQSAAAATAGTTTGEVRKEELLEEGMSQWTPEQRKRSVAYLTSIATTGLTPWEMEQQEALREGITPDMVRQGYIIDKGIALGARDVLQNNQFLQRLEVEWANLRQDKTFREAELALREKGLLLSEQQLAAEMAAGRGEQAFRELQELRQVLEVTQTAGSEMERQTARAMVNQLIASLTAKGIIPPKKTNTDPRTGREVLMPMQFTEEDIRRWTMGRTARFLWEWPYGEPPATTQPWGVQPPILGGQVDLPFYFGRGPNRFEHAPRVNPYLQPTRPPFIP